MPLVVGTRLGPYEILAPLGAGGMGEVYRARDPRLDREVAIKVLPEEVSQDPERRHRFEREARAAGALNQPNVLVIHEVGTHEDALYVVSCRQVLFMERSASVASRIMPVSPMPPQVARNSPAFSCREQFIMSPLASSNRSDSTWSQKLPSM